LDPTRTIPEPLKQHPIKKKDHSFLFPRRRLSELEANMQRFRKKLPDPYLIMAIEV
jgi:hypothetical protein